MSDTQLCSGGCGRVSERPVENGDYGQEKGEERHKKAKTIKKKYPEKIGER